MLCMLLVAGNVLCDAATARDRSHRAVHEIQIAPLIRQLNATARDRSHRAVHVQTTIEKRIGSLLYITWIEAQK